MRMKFGRLIARGEGWRAAVLASPHYAGLSKPNAYVVWCDDCGDFMPAWSRATRCKECRAAPPLATCQNPECDASVVSRNAKYCSEACKEGHRVARKAERLEQVQRMREQGLTLDAIARELRIGHRTVNGMLYGVST
jgi:hypothetical protein